MLISVILSDSAIIVSGIATIITAAGTVYTRYTLMRIRRGEAANKELIESLKMALEVERGLNTRLSSRVNELETKVESLQAHLAQFFTQAKKSTNVASTKTTTTNRRAKS
jgi:hypothetical protein